MAPTYTLLPVTSAVPGSPSVRQKCPALSSVWPSDVKMFRHKISKITQPLQVLPTMKEDTILEKIVNVFVLMLKFLRSPDFKY